jgi:hypothetical protein
VGASSSIGATTITVASGTGLVAGLALKVGSGATSEYAQVGVGYTTGTSVPVVGGGAGGGLLYAHTTSDAVVAASTHVFKQSINPSDRATYSITIFDTLTTVGYSGAALSDLDIKIDPKSAVTLSSKFKSFQGVPQSSMTPAYTARPPILGWQWLMTNAGASSTRGTSYDLKIKRKIDVIHSSDGIQSPREIFQGALDVDGSYKAIYENQTDLNLFLQYIQTPVTATLQQPVAAGGSSLTLTTSKSGFTKGKREWQTYVEASFSLSGIYNSTDAGILTATLTNFQSTAY